MTTTATHLYRAGILWLLAGAPAALGAPAQPPAGPTDQRELEAFLDGVLAAQSLAHHLVGVTIAVVRGEEVLLAKGYGRADLENGKEVDPARTLFRIGSVTKLFTWTAVMQMAERGMVDLDADVNTYLGDLEIPATFSQPITLRHLMSHTAGFEERVVGLFARSPDRLRPLEDLLRRDLPARVRPPGQFTAYSNHGAALAGHIVARAAGVSWEDYVEKHILEPLGMSHTSVRQPVPDGLEPDLARGYSFQQGVQREQSFEYIPLAPAGAASATAEDMTRFIAAHLRHGRYRSERILEEETARTMHRPLFRNDPRVNAMLHGFYEMSRNGVRIFGHEGDTIAFHSVLAIFPEHDLGLFVSYNSDTGARARGELLKMFVNRYFPPPPVRAPEPPPGFAERLRHLQGSYRPLRVSHTTLAKLALLLSTFRVRGAGGGRLFTVGSGLEPQRWIEVEPFVFREIEGSDLLVFRESEGTGDRHAFVSSAPGGAFVKLRPAATPAFHLFTLTLLLLAFASTIARWPVFARRHPRSTANAHRGAHLVGWLFSAISLLFALGLGLALSKPFEIAFGVSPVLKATLFLPLVGAPLLIATMVYAVRSWIKSYWEWPGRLHYTLVALSGAVFYVWLAYWNLLGFRY